MIEYKIRFKLLIPSIKDYNKDESLIKNIKKKSKLKKKEKKSIITEPKKQIMIPQVINICEEAYQNMLQTPILSKLPKLPKYKRHKEAIRKAWLNLPINERLNAHFDEIAHDLKAISYSYEIFNN